VTIKTAHRNGVAGGALDEVDARIVELITSDARISNRALAARLGIAEATVRRRRVRLEEAHHIRYFALPNPRLLHYMDVMVWVRVEPSRVMGVAQALAASPRTRSVDIISGPYDLLVSGYFTSSDDLLEFLTNCVAAQPGVTATETFQSLRAIKRHFVAEE
jgi:Lrp/AsnC family transcriptional regulator for asnA, asnC and gidA